MFIQSPRPEQTLHLRAVVSDIWTLRDFAAELADRHARMLCHAVAEKMTKTTNDEATGQTTYEVNAVVLSNEEYQQLLQQAYMLGFRDARTR